jgi:transposase-like protein
MGEASYEVLKRPLESDLPEQIEVRVRRERRRRWTAEDKLRIVQEAFAPNAVAKHVAERHEISTGLLFTWRRQLMARGRSSFLAIQLNSRAEADAPAPCPATSSPPGSIEIEMPNGARVRAGHDADLKILRTVLAALDGR